MKREKPPDDVLEGPGFKMVRRGRYIEFASHRSPQEQAELERRLWESRAKLLDEIRAKTAEFLEILHKYTTFDLVANLLLINCMHDPNEYKEWESKLRPHYVEHAAVLELKDPRFELREPVLVEPSDLTRANTLLDEIFMQAMWYYGAEFADPDADPVSSRIHELRFTTLLYGMFVRFPAYASHWREVLLGLSAHTSTAERISTAVGLEAIS